MILLICKTAWMLYDDTNIHDSINAKIMLTSSSSSGRRTIQPWSFACRHWWKRHQKKFSKEIVTECDTHWWWRKHCWWFGRWHLWFERHLVLALPHFGSPPSLHLIPVYSVFHQVVLVINIDFKWMCNIDYCFVDKTNHSRSWHYSQTVLQILWF